MALGQTTEFAESSLRLIGLDWAVPDFSTFSPRQKTLKVNIPYRSSGLWSSGRRVRGPRCRAERLYRAWHTRHGSRGVNPSKDGGSAGHQPIFATELSVSITSRTARSRISG
jgi:hypothetical protein